MKILIYLIFTTLSGRHYYIYMSEEAEHIGGKQLVKLSIAGDYRGNINPGDHSPQC